MTWMMLIFTDVFFDSYSLEYSINFSATYLIENGK